VDIRLNNTSQLAAFTKARDLPFFLQELLGVEYRHELLLAPTQDMLKRYRRKGGTWEEYENAFLSLMAERRIESSVDRDLFTGKPVLLCSEPTAEHCHRRLVAEYLQEKWKDVEIRHL